MEQDARAAVRRVVVDHLTLPVADFGASRGFYLSALAPLGFGIVGEAEHEATFGAEDAYDVFSVQAAAPGAPTGGVHVAFAADGPEAVDAFHAAALEAGGETTAARVRGPTTGRATTPPSSSTPTATTWRRSTSAEPGPGTRDAPGTRVFQQAGSK